MADTRLASRQGELIDRSRQVSFTWQGAEVSGYAGDTIASALFAAGTRVFSRSFKYHRRRGLMCCAGQCPNCLVNVDGEPTVRACVTPIEQGMTVSHLNAWPSLNRDFLHLVGRLTPSFGMQVGFYYKTFIHPRRAWPLYEKVLRNAAGLGKLDPEHRRTDRYEKIHRHVDVLVIGGGEAGLEAAAEAAEAGKHTALVDEGLALGGYLAWGGPKGHARLEELLGRITAAGVEVLQPAFAGGVYEGLLVPVYQGRTMHRVRPAELVIATGAIEQPLVFGNNDLPGVMLGTAARRLVNQFRVMPGEEAVVVTSSDEGFDAACDLTDGGVNVVAVADARPNADGSRVEDAGIEYLPGFQPLQAKGSKAVSGVVVTRNGESRSFGCDLLVMAGGSVGHTAFVTQGGGTIRYDRERRRYVPDSLPKGMRVVGSAAGTAAAAGAVPAKAPKTSCKQMVCFCEDVTTKDIGLSLDEGFRSLELSKRYTTVTMGPCQGRMCHRNSGLVIADELGLDPDAQRVGVTTARAPHNPTSFSLLAARGYEPVKRTSTHHWHAEHGGKMLWAGDWKRPYDYGDAQSEADAVHESLGLIDVSTLGKLIVRGPDAAAFLERLYPNRFGDMKLARVRYGIVCGDDGSIIDDGTVARLSDTEYYVTTTSSGAGGMEQWFTWWNAVWKMDCEIVNVTSTIAAFNLAGPNARTALQGLTDFDLSNEAFPYLGAGQAQIAGVPCLVLRIGFVGELGYEIHLPSAAGEHLWEKLMEAGEPYAVKPFGLEPQRVLRLEKMHIIVGQDTNAESNPLEAGMPWIVKLDKESDWIGRYAIEWYKNRGDRFALVGWEAQNGKVPVEGTQVIGSDGGPAGRITSSRFSRRLGKAIGIAWVPLSMSEDGTGITISDPSGATIPATVTHKAFYDPDGERLRS
ncbi:MAG TPA: 2Fe-2S iron-sulfur cluster-binding protein [Gaiellales bacterium]|nr:2Fe-2S iron-sulfur cluster-binding protein [Gaiellales bacterium]